MNRIGGTLDMAALAALSGSPRVPVAVAGVDTVLAHPSLVPVRARSQLAHLEKSREGTGAETGDQDQLTQAAVAAEGARYPDASGEEAETHPHRSPRYRSHARTLRRTPSRSVPRSAR